MYNKRCVLWKFLDMICCREWVIQPWEALDTGDLGVVCSTHLWIHVDWKAALMRRDNLWLESNQLLGFPLLPGKKKAEEWKFPFADEKKDPWIWGKCSNVHKMLGHEMLSQVDNQILRKGGCTWGMARGRVRWGLKWTWGWRFWNDSHSPIHAIVMSTKLVQRVMNSGQVLSSMTVGMQREIIEARLAQVKKQRRRCMTQNCL